MKTLMNSMLVCGMLSIAIAFFATVPQQGMAETETVPDEASDGKATDAGLPDGAIMKLGTSAFRHGTRIDAFSVSGDAKFAVATSGNLYRGVARAYDLSDGSVKYQFPPEPSFVEAVGVSPNGKVVATRSETTVAIRDPKDGSIIRKVELQKENSRSLTSWICFSRDSKYLATTGNGKVIEVIDIDEGKVISSFHHQRATFACSFSPDSKSLVSGGFEQAGGVYVAIQWDATSGKELKKLINKNAGLRSLAFSPDGALIAGGGDNGQLRIWKEDSGELLHEFPKNGNRIRAVAFDPKGEKVVAASDQMHVYDLKSKELVLRIDQRVYGIHIAADGSVITGSVAGALYQWDLATGKVLTPVDANDSAIDQIVVTSNGRQVITHDQGGVAHVWDAASGRHQHTLKLGWQKEFAVSPDSRFLVFGKEDESVHFRDKVRENMFHTGSRIEVIDLESMESASKFNGFEGDAQAIEFSPDGNSIITVDFRDGLVRVWDFAAGELVRTFSALPEEAANSYYLLKQARVSPDGKTIAIGYGRETRELVPHVPVYVRIWNLETGEMLHRLNAAFDQIETMSFSNDCRNLVTSGGTLRGAGLTQVWNVETGQLVSPSQDGLPVSSLACTFSRDGRLLATADQREIAIWETSTWQRRCEFKGHRDIASTLTFGPDGRLYSGGMDAKTLVWNTQPKFKTERSLDQLWDDLTADAEQAFKAQGAFHLQNAEFINFMKTKLSAAQPIDPAKIKAFIEQLQSEKFAEREKATKSLLEIGFAATSELAKVAETGDAEAKQRSIVILKAIESEKQGKETLRIHRAFEVLEWIADQDASDFLATLADGFPDAWQTVAAQQSLNRISQRNARSK